jgi:hypothetical protein
MKYVSAPAPLVGTGLHALQKLLAHSWPAAQLAWPVPQQRVGAGIASGSTLVLGMQVPSVDDEVAAQHTLSMVPPGQKVTEAAFPDAVHALETHRPALQMVCGLGVMPAWKASLRQSLSLPQAAHVLVVEHTFPSLGPVQSALVRQSPRTHRPMRLHTKPAP